MSHVLVFRGHRTGLGGSDKMNVFPHVLETKKFKIDGQWLRDGCLPSVSTGLSQVHLCMPHLPVLVRTLVPLGRSQSN